MPLSRWQTCSAGVRRFAASFRVGAAIWFCRSPEHGCPCLTLRDAFNLASVYSLHSPIRLAGPRYTFQRSRPFRSPDRLRLRLRPPRVVAKGAGYIAERITAIAEAHGVEIYEDADLVEVLSKMDIDREIPESLYQAVAEVLAFVYRVNRETS